jgi:hypothetical protein
VLRVVGLAYLFEITVSDCILNFSEGLRTSGHDHIIRVCPQLNFALEKNGEIYASKVQTIYEAIR